MSGLVLEQRGGLEGGERLAAAGGVPDVAVAAVLVDAVDDGLDGVDLVRPHHQQLLLAGDEHHVAADHLAERAFGEELLGEVVEVGDLVVVLGRELVDGQEALVGVEGEVAGVVVGEVPGVGAVADDEELHEAEERPGVAVAGVVLVFDDLLHGPAGADAEGLQLDLDDGHAVDEQDDVVAVVAVVGVDAELVDDLEGVLAPVLDVDEGVVQRRAVVAGEASGCGACGRREDVGRDDLVEQALELAVGELDPVQGFKVFPEAHFKCRPITNVRANGVLEAMQLLDQRRLDVDLVDHQRWLSRWAVVREVGRNSSIPNLMESFLMERAVGFDVLDSPKTLARRNRRSDGRITPSAVPPSFGGASPNMGSWDQEV